MPRDSKGRFISKEAGDNMVIALPSIFTVLKMLIFAVILYPWYYIISRQSFFEGIFENLFYGQPLSMSATVSSKSSPPPPFGKKNP